MATKVASREEFLSDILITATEGGINYWAQVAKRLWKPGREFLYQVDLIDLEEEGSLNGKPVGNLLSVGYPQLEGAIAQVLAAEFEVREDIRQMVFQGNLHNDAGEIDADAADVIIQAAVFGEIVYS